MKKHSKILALVAALAICLSTALGLVACGEAKTVTDVYTAVGRFTTQPETAQELAISYSTTVELYSDNTYVLTDLNASYMGAYGGTVVGTFTSVWMGTYTKEAGEDEDETIVKLSKPTRIVYSQYVMAGGSVYFDTSDAATFADAEDLTADSLMAKGKELTLTVVGNRITDGLTPGQVMTLFGA